MKGSKFDNTGRIRSKPPEERNKILLRDIYIISLDSCLESRYNPLLERMKKAEVTYDITKITAIPGASLEGAPHKLTPNTWACTLSHIKAIETAQANKLPCVLIIEDDVDFVPEFSAHLDEIMELLPHNWDAVWLGGINSVPAEDYNITFNRVWSSWGAFGYILKENMYGRFINGLKASGKASDDYFRSQHRLIKCLRPKRDMITHTGIPSVRKPK